MATNLSEAHPWVERCPKCKRFPNDTAAAQAVARVLTREAGEPFRVVIDEGMPYVERSAPGAHELTFCDAEHLLIRLRGKRAVGLVVERRTWRASQPENRGAVR
jgi:hypothetical protein